MTRLESELGLVTGPERELVLVTSLKKVAETENGSKRSNGSLTLLKNRVR